MPHITLEYSDNLPDQPDFRALFAELHQALVSLGDVQVNDIKSRAIKLTDWYAGDGNPRHAFVHLKLYFINRRTDEFKRRALAVMQPIVAAHYATSLNERDCQLCFELVDIQGDYYAKIVSN
ncbi:5-carboxymethyl-2-hydroxymuconate Delta-isomerase [Chitinimonas sp. BJB300]|uniref:5-carboxymethyl-2-hydroxymuconate Delta-isomerase n=1 Tax=Chitinimonas sp. BJB300 TaxID=1559339 RepID=UPI000C10204A|nr:5-carboxymethyl-2-hydroxymuconate Delta-isomerase [Chitinimonas sp. BJB300]PHV12610.1 hypothetical protein CSQ89_04870 [Chitinimonas sp. BJB300]TSJ89926.1 5-carboxymethyl-2-hydroxymuconate Delta-isomerase [Chitinimonas sp. BJB300]